jgi:hypothetical protein
LRKKLGGSCEKSGHPERLPSFQARFAEKSATLRFFPAKVIQKRFSSFFSRKNIKPTKPNQKMRILLAALAASAAPQHVAAGLRWEILQ